jgi:hypothetical protein
VLARANLLNLKRDGKICNVPLYAVSQLHGLVTASDSAIGAGQAARP